jgi:hypothetical protein
VPAHPDDDDGGSRGILSCTWHSGFLVAAQTKTEIEDVAPRVGGALSRIAPRSRCH